MLRHRFGLKVDDLEEAQRVWSEKGLVAAALLEMLNDDERLLERMLPPLYDLRIGADSKRFHGD